MGHKINDVDLEKGQDCKEKYVEMEDRMRVLFETPKDPGGYCPGI
jgi:hypothetical protein